MLFKLTGKRSALLYCPFLNMAESNGSIKEEHIYFTAAAELKKTHTGNLLSSTLGKVHWFEILQMAFPFQSKWFPGKVADSWAPGFLPLR